jgi:hypothetical protein
MKNVTYIKHHPHSAGKWIYEGYARAWEFLGFNVKFFNELSEIKNDASYVMTTESDILNDTGVLSDVEKSFVFVQPFTFPQPWGSHPNWVTSVSHECAEKTNSKKSIKKWTFVNGVHGENYKPWNEVSYFPLAFDSIGYQLPDFDIKKEFDVCFIGGWANNGFNEKQKRIIDYLSLIQRSNLKCGFFVNSGLNHNEENFVLCSSKIALNIHDEYQVQLGLDLNERTYKSLATSGILVSDNVKEMENIFPHIKLANNPEEMMDLINQYMKIDDDDLISEKIMNRNEILKNHTYIKRVERMLQI